VRTRAITRPVYRDGRPRPPALALLALAAAFAVLLSGCAPRTVTEQGHAIGGLYNLFLAVAAVIWLIVTGLMIWNIARYRQRDDRLPKQIHGSNRLELTWTLIPTVIVLVLFVFTVRVQNQVQSVSAAPGARVDALAFQWQWQFTHLGPDGAPLRVVTGEPGSKPVLMVPVGQPVRVRLTSNDVTHSFFVPRSMFKRMAIPGRASEFEMTFSHQGRFAGNCSQYCGLQHDRMVFDVEAVPPDRYQAWLRGGSP
jgi:cytochrome c oxidase subunit II